jgi:predicted nucleic acid-binding protein
MNNGVAILDSGPIFSLAAIKKLELPGKLFDEIRIPKAVWHEVTLNKSTPYYPDIYHFFKKLVVENKNQISKLNYLDKGEIEAIVLYQEMKADYLVIEDRKARNYAESKGINCIGTLGILNRAKEKGLIDQIRPYFVDLILNKRYYSVDLLNQLLRHLGENEIK